MKITSKQAVKARKEINLSQAAVSSQTGITRNVMSAFESQNIMLLDKLQDRLVSFYANSGIDFSSQIYRDLGEPVEVAASAVLETDLGLGPLGDYRDYVNRDGFCVPVGLPEEHAEDVLAELHRVEARIEELESSACSNGLFGGYTEECDSAFQELLALCARWRQLVNSLSGRDRQSPFRDSDAEGETFADRVVTLIELFWFGAVSSDCATEQR